MFGKHHFYEWRNAPSSKGDNRGQFWEWELGYWKVSRLNRVIAIDGGKTSLVNVDLTGKILLEKGLQTVIVSTYPSINGKGTQRFQIRETTESWLPVTGRARVQKNLNLWGILCMKPLGYSCV